MKTETCIKKKTKLGFQIKELRILKNYKICKTLINIFLASSLDNFLLLYIYLTTN